MYNVFSGWGAQGFPPLRLTPQCWSTEHILIIYTLLMPMSQCVCDLVNIHCTCSGGFLQSNKYVIWDNHGTVHNWILPGNECWSKVSYVCSMCHTAALWALEMGLSAGGCLSFEWGSVSTFPCIGMSTTGQMEQLLRSQSSALRPSILTTWWPGFRSSLMMKPSFHQK